MISKDATEEKVLRLVVNQIFFDIKTLYSNSTER
jgi:hypothetical protein